MGNTNDLGAISGGYDSDTDNYFQKRVGGTAFDVANYSKDSEKDLATALQTGDLNAEQLSKLQES